MPQHPTHPPTLGARYLGEQRCRFRVWAPKSNHVRLRLLGESEREVPLVPHDDGYFERLLAGIPPGTRYLYLLDNGHARPDPASRFQPTGIHEPSAVVDPAFAWTDHDWRGIPLHRYVAYELHVGTFTAEGTFDGVIQQLGALRELGITAIELMPVAQFPGERNWGYDGVHPFAVQNTYGGPAGLKRLVNACHLHDIAVILDVVYNHLGPEGNYLGEFGYYFTDRYRTPWGDAINFDDRHSDHVRRFFIENALYWIDEYHIDALRLDAVHTIYDSSARPFLRELADAVRLEGERLNRRVYTIGESSANDPRLVQPADVGGHGIDAQWCNDLHHALRTTLSQEEGGYYADFHGFADLVHAYNKGYVLEGQYSHYRGRAHGKSGRTIPPHRLMVFAQNHDQVGNRRGGERLAQLVGFEQLKLAAALVLLSPYLPLLFMGEEYGATTPFHYFISHLDPVLAEAVRQSRRREFCRFDGGGEFADPLSPDTFACCRLDHARLADGPNRVLRGYYQELIELRRANAALAFADRERIEVTTAAEAMTMIVRRWSSDQQFLLLLHCDAQPVTIQVPLPTGTWTRISDSAATEWLGPGTQIASRVESSGLACLTLAPYSAVILREHFEDTP